MSSTSALPHRPEYSAEELDERIRQAESRLVAREQALRGRFGALTRRVRDAARPGRWWAPLLGIAAGAFALTWVLRRAVPSAMSAPARVAATHRELPWTWLIGLAWPLLPASWRSRISPGTAAAAVTIGLPLLEALFVRPAWPALATAPRVDPARFAGTWHQIARLPEPSERACANQPSATYALQDGNIVAMVRRCREHDGRLREEHGVVRLVPDTGDARWRVSFFPPWLRWLPFAWSEHWILHVDDDYQVALVGHPNRRFLWLLSRRPTLGSREIGPLLDLAAQRGFAVERLVLVQP